MTTGTTYNATVQGFNDNGLVVLSTFDGARAIAKQTGNGELKPGQNVVLQRSGVPGLSDICFDPTATPTLPKVWPVELEVEDAKASISILYSYEGKLWVGGRKKLPEKVLDQSRSHLQLSDISFIGISSDSLGWEVYVQLKTKALLFARPRKESKAVPADYLDISSLSKGLLRTYSGTTANPLVSGYPKDYIKYSGSGARSEHTYTSPNSNSYSSSGSLPGPWQRFQSSYSSSRVFAAIGSNATTTISGSYYSLIDSDGEWAIIAKATNNAVETVNGNTGTSTVEAFVASSTAQVPIGTVYVDASSTIYLSLVQASSTVVSRSYANFSYPMLIETDNRGDTKSYYMDTKKYKHKGLAGFKVKLYSIFNYEKVSATITLLGGNTPVATVEAKAWGIPKDANILDVSCWLPNMSKYLP
jgi:hypothetical protein